MHIRIIINLKAQRWLAPVRANRTESPSGLYGESGRFRMERSGKRERGVAFVFRAGAQGIGHNSQHWPVTRRGQPPWSLSTPPQSSRTLHTDMFTKGLSGGLLQDMRGKMLIVMKPFEWTTTLMMYMGKQDQE